MFSEEEGLCLECLHLSSRLPEDSRPSRSIFDLYRLYFYSAQNQIDLHGSRRYKFHFHNIDTHGSQQWHAVSAVRNFINKVPLTE